MLLYINITTYGII